MLHRILRLLIVFAAIWVLFLLIRQYGGYPLALKITILLVLLQPFVLMFASYLEERSKRKGR
jgi:Na+-translocating ferredoxin:NAD+ oxidoreductase RnfD subunit